MTILNDADAVFVGDIPAVEVYAGDLLVWPVDYTKIVFLTVHEHKVHDVNYARDALGDTPSTYARISASAHLPKDTWLFPTAADMGIPLTATLDTVKVMPFVNDDITFDLFYKTGTAWDDRQKIQRKRFFGHGDQPFTFTNKPATWLQYGLQLQIYTGVRDGRFYRAQLTVDWSY